MAVPASHIVAMSSRVLSGGSNDLETNGLALTKSALIPTSTPAVLFSSASDVSAFFGPEADETAFAQQYFTGVTNQQTAPKTLVFGRRVDADAPAWLRSAKLATDLAALKKVTDGALKITVGGELKTASGVDFSECASLSDCAETLATAVTGVTGTYDSNSNTITLTTSAVGDDATISYAEAGEGGTDLAALLGFTEEAGAVGSQGAGKMTEAANLNAVCEVTRNWVGFTTLWETEDDEAKAFAAWADGTGDDYVYVDWTTDEKCTDQLTQASTKAAQLVDLYNCAATVYGTWRDAAFVLAVGASIAWNRTQGMKTWFAKDASGITPRVVSEAAANALEAIRVNYSGEFATRNADFTFFNRGTLTSDFYGFIDVLYGSIYLRNAIQRSVMDGFAQINRAPYNARGEALIRAWIQDPINRCKLNGVIDEGLTLSEAQKAQILQETGDEEVANALFTKGFWVGITMPAANERADRDAPVVTLYYAYAGAVQKLSVETTAVL